MSGIKSDEDILSAIFNPEFPLGLESSGLAKKPQSCDQMERKDEILTDVERSLRAREVEGVRKAEAGQLQDALQIFSEVISENTERASGYNNRAQVLQLIGRQDDALLDLDKALSFGEIPNDIARKSLFQRAMIKRVKGDDDGARKDFEEAARLGDEFAMREAAKLNPYAAMCNQMLSQVMMTWKQGNSENTSNSTQMCNSGNLSAS